MKATVERATVDAGPELTGSPFDPATTHTGRRKSAPGLSIRLEVKDRMIPSDPEKFEAFLLREQAFAARVIDGYLRSYRLELRRERNEDS